MLSATLLKDIGAETQRALERDGARSTLPPGTDLFTHGDTIERICLILSGRLRLWRVSERGVALTLMVAFPGETLGLLPLFRGTANPATCTAIVATEVIAWPPDLIHRLVERDPAFRDNVLRIVSGRADLLIERLFELSTGTIEERIAAELLRLAAAIGRDGPERCLAVPVTRQELADLASATIHSVSRVMARWRVQGLIAGARGEVVLRDLAAMLSLAGRPPEPLAAE